jgi:hypothetical protein
MQLYFNFWSLKPWIRIRIWVYLKCGKLLKFPVKYTLVLIFNVYGTIF